LEGLEQSEALEHIVKIALGRWKPERERLGVEALTEPIIHQLVVGGRQDSQAGFANQRAQGLIKLVVHNLPHVC
jgi:hypothetical protein